MNKTKQKYKSFLQELESRLNKQGFELNPTMNCYIKNVYGKSPTFDKSDAFIIVRELNEMIEEKNQAYAKSRFNEDYHFKDEIEIEYLKTCKVESVIKLAFLSLDELDTLM
ncbi:TPA: hypothetical protein RQJ58_000842 [Vibrio vulnificus]|nr:hypothetical protein [Vibrio vulnificus]